MSPPTWRQTKDRLMIEFVEDQIGLALAPNVQRAYGILRVGARELVEHGPTYEAWRLIDEGMCGLEAAFGDVGWEDVEPWA